VDTGFAELLPDADREQAWLLRVDGIAQSYVDLADPRHVEFDYLRLIADVADLTAAPGRPLRALHLGGGAMTLARYLAATRPGSSQLVVEVDRRLVAFVDEVLPRPPGVELLVRDATGAVEALAGWRAELAVCDVFTGARVPAELSGPAFLAGLVRLLSPRGLLVVNVLDGRDLRLSRSVAAGCAERLRHLAVLASPAVLRRRRAGNVVIVASRRFLPTAALRRRAAREEARARLLTDRELTAWIGDLPPIGAGLPGGSASSDPLAPGRVRFGADR
jgi:spermidine synthase